MGSQASKQQQQQQQPTGQNNPQKAAQKTPQKPSNQQSEIKQKSEQIDESQIWIYDYLVQYLTSPLWKVPIYEFLDEHCIVFDDEEENKFSYTKIHKEFKDMIEIMISQLMEEVGIDEKLLLKFVEIGLKSKQKKIFEQLLIVDNFLVFKKLMVKRNKELELEALKEVMKEDKQPHPEDIEKLKLASLEADKAQLEHAIQMSVSAEEEIKKMNEVEDEELKQVLEMSKVTYQTEEQTRSKIQESEKSKEKDTEEKEKKAQEKERMAQEKAKQQAEEQARKQALEEEKAKKKAEEQQRLKKEAEEKAKREEEYRLMSEQKRKQAIEEEKQRQEEENRKRKLEEERIKQEEEKRRKEEEEKRKEEDEKKSKYEEEKKRKVEEEKRKILGQISSKKEEYKPLDKLPVLKQISTLPPLVDNKYEKPMEDLLKDRAQLLNNYKEVEENLRNQQLEVKEEKKEESLDERKKRLIEQRELLRKKKQVQREQELKEYQETGTEGKKNLASQGSVLLQEGSSVQTPQSIEELRRKQNLMSKIKQNM